MARGLLLVNLGTPDTAGVGSVKRYLREFLSDPRVIDLPAVSRFLLVNGIIVPFRGKKSSEAYKKVWTPRGSPLLFHSEDLRDAVRTKLGESWRVELAMRYGRPSLPEAIERLAGAEPLVVLPLYPQYASASTGSSLERVFELIRTEPVVPSVSVVPPFYDDATFIAAFAKNAREVIDREKSDHVLMSFHGLPERQIKAADWTHSYCLANDRCCDSIGEPNASCYRAQCFSTARSLASALGLAKDRWSVSFQSRLGKTPWIKPWTDEVIPELAKKGVKRVAVVCGAFVADCLETLEEIGMRASDQFKSAGGESLTLVPSLNATPAWVDCVVSMAERTAAAPAARAALAVVR